LKWCDLLVRVLTRLDVLFLARQRRCWCRTLSARGLTRPSVFVAACTQSWRYT